MTDLFEVLSKQYGSSVKHGDKLFDGGVIPTGILKIDNAIGIGGIPRRKVTQLYGQESSGKSTIALQTVANAQRLGLQVVYIDAEASMSAKYAEALGVNIQKLIIVQPETAEDVMAIVKESMEAEAGLIVIDSIPALPTRYEEGGEIGDAHMGQLAKLMAQASRIWTPVLNKNDTAILAVNQLRAKIGQYAPGGKPIPGGHHWKHRVDVNIYLKIIKNDDKVREIKFKIEKNKVGDPLKEDTFTIVHGIGVSLPYQLIQAGLDEKILKKAGSWIKYGDDTLGQGVAAMDGLMERRELCLEILNKVCVNPENYEKFLSIS